MNKKIPVLFSALIVSGALVAGAGAYIKYGVLRPLGLFQEKNIIALPFELMTDDAMQFIIRDALDTSPPETTPAPSVPEPTIVLPTLPPPTETEQTEPSQPETSAPTEAPSVPTEPSETVPPETVPPETVPPETEPPETAPPTQPPETEPPTQPPETQPEDDFRVVDYGQFGGVDDSWFDNTLFIGDSRTEGLRDYARLGKADYFASRGMGIFNVFSTQASDQFFGTKTLSELLNHKQYDRIYISLGLNDCGYSLNAFSSAYQKMVSKIRELQPDATIILQDIMTVGRRKAAAQDYFAPTRIQQINQEIKKNADWDKVYYIESNQAFADEDGYLPNYLSGDGCHLYIKYYYLQNNWMRYVLKELNI